MKARIFGWGLLALLLALLAPKDDSDSDSGSSDSGSSDSGSSEVSASAGGVSEESDSDFSDSGRERAAPQDPGAAAADPTSHRRSGRPAYPTDQDLGAIPPLGPPPDG
jgi:hypothetical protein